MDHDKQHKLNTKHAANPEPGDYWAETMCGICVVTDVDEFTVTYGYKKKDCDANHWTWDLTVLENRTREEFSDWLRYGSGTDGYWAYVYPGAHAWVLSELKTTPFKVIPFVKKPTIPVSKSKPAPYKWATYEDWKDGLSDGGSETMCWSDIWEAARK